MFVMPSSGFISSIVFLHKFLLPVTYSDILAIILGYVGPFAGRVFGLCIPIGAMALGDDLEILGKFARNLRQWQLPSHQ